MTAAPALAYLRKRLKLTALTLLVVFMTLTVAGALWLVHKQSRHLALPTLHSELWQAYQVHAELDRMQTAAQSLLQGTLPSDDMVVRVQVLRSLVEPLSGQHLFDFLPESRPAAQATLGRIEMLSRRWDAMAHWGDAQGSRRVAEEVLQELPTLRQPIHEVLVATNISLANELDAEREHLYQYFTSLGWALLGLLLGGSLLVARLIIDYRKAHALSNSLAELNQSLEQRVSQRTAELSEGQALLMQILDASPSDVALIASQGHQVYFVNQRLLERLGLKHTSEFRLDRLFVNAREAMHFREALLARHRVDDWESQLAGDESYWGVVSGRLLEYRGAPAQLIWCYDISLRKRMEQELLVLATTDALTGLSNRHAFMQRAADLVKSAERFDQPCTLLMLDIDHFKQVNDLYGHQSGDEVLAKLGQLLLREMREVDIVGRLGGEEFAALLTQTDPTSAAAVAERLRSAVQKLQLKAVDGRPLHLTVSIGAAARRPAEPLEGVMSRADSALYQAKSNGRNRVEHASP